MDGRCKTNLGRIPMKNLYAAFLCILISFSALTKSQARSFGGINGNTIGSDQTICNNTTPVPLTGSTPGGGTGIYTYQWQVSSTSSIAGFANIGGATAQGYSPGVLTSNRWYRRIVASGLFLDTTAAVTITVTPVITAASNIITGTQTICYNTLPATLSGPTATGGNGTYTYQWLSSTDNLTYTNIFGATGITYTSPALTVTTWFKRLVTSGGCTNLSAAVLVTITPVITPGSNTISGAQSVCNGQTPFQLPGSTPAGGTGGYTYLWESSTTSATTGFSTAAGTSNGKNYTPLALTQSTWFHRIVISGGCTDISPAVLINVAVAPPGNPSVFGNGVWNVYGYSDNAFTTYTGYYTEPSLTFSTTSRYLSSQSPSFASGYQGCQIPLTGFSVSMKQTNFTPGIYQLNLDSLDDNVNIFLNGTQIYAHTCCVTAAPINNLWTGSLGATDQMELRWVQATGPAFLSLQFQPVTPAPLVPGSISQNLQVCYGEVPPAGFTNSASPTTGCSTLAVQWQKSIDSVTWVPIVGATALTYTETAALIQTTWYRRLATDACNNSIATTPVKVTVNVVAPGDPTVYGNNIWNVYVFQGNGAYSAATYKGYYTEPLLSFNSTNRWANTASPSSASGYQGCVVNPLNTWIDYKRTNFTPAIYQIDIPYHDDYAYLYINGILVFSHLGCCDSHINVWTGPLGPTDQVEYRVSQGGGPSSEALTLTPVTPPTLTSGTIVPSQTICAGNVPPTPFTESVAPTGGCTINNYTWDYSIDNGVTWTNISGANAISYTPTTSVYLQTLFRRTVYDVCGNSAVAIPDTVYMNNSAPGNPAVYGNNTWNVYCFQDINYSIYAGYYTEPLLTFQTTNRYPSTSPPSTASGYQGCQLINTYYSVSMKRTGFTAGIYQIDVTSDDDYNLIYINGVLVSSLTYPTIQNNVWTGNLGPTDQIEVRWRNNAGPGQTGVRFTLVTPTPLLPGSIIAYNPNLCYNDLPIINEVTPASGGCFVNYTWQSSIDGGTTWTTVAGATGNTFSGTVSPTTNIQYRRVATDICGNVAYSAPVTFTQTAGTVGNPSVYGNGVWNVYAYDAAGPGNPSAFSTAQYLGYYVEPLLSFNSLNRWSATGSPSDASGYQGCQVDQDNHWVSYRQTNFTPATYQIDVPYHDDDAYLFINGVQVWSQAGCCVASTNVWTGILGATDKVEFRWREYNGSSSGAVNFTVVTPATTVIPGTIAAGQTICANSTPAAFTSTTDATSSCFVYYQWQSSPDNTTWTDIAGATSNVYAPGPVAAKTYFQRKAINACGVIAYSNTVIVDVYPGILTAGTIANNQTICSGTVPAAFTSTALPTGGNGTYTYQWQSSLDNIGWSNIAGATATAYSPVGVLTATTYYRRNTTSCGSSVFASSNTITVTVNPLPVITTQPANPSSCVNGSTSISVAATGAGLTYQWQVNTGSGFTNVTNVSPYSGATTSTLTINPVIAGMAGYKYQVIISGTCAPILTSNIVTLAVSNNAVITTQPANKTYCEGSNAIFFINASGTGITYQWQQNISGTWTNLVDNAVYSGTLTPTLTITGVVLATMNGNIYRCVLNTTCPGVLNSNQAILTVVAAPSNTIASNQTVCSGIAVSTLTGPAASSYTWQSSTVSSTTGFVNVSNGQNYSPGTISTTTYYQRIAGNGTCTNTSNVVTVTLNSTPIAITSQPAGQNICAGGNATFTATATGPGTLTYQWYENGTPITDGGIYSGSSTNTLTLTGATAGMNNYTYYVAVYASGCSAVAKNSNTVTLTTSNSPTVVTNAPSFVTCQGSSVALTMTASGVGLTYQWQILSGATWNNLSNFGSYSNVNGNSLKINPTTVAMDGSQYRVIVSGTCSPFTATSATTTMNVISPVANNSIANSQNLCAGTPAPFTGSTPTGGNGAYTYQWYLNSGSGWFAISGANGINYSSGPLSVTTQYYRAVSSGGCAAVNSPTITVTILPPTSTTDPSNTTVCAGTNATFTVVGTGSGLSYQWQVNTGSGWSNVINGASYTGVTTATLTVVNPPYGFNNYQYRCVVGGGCIPLSVTSNPATLTVNPTAVITGQPGNVNTCAGSTATYTVTASGAGLSYQWMEKVSAGVFTNITNGGIYSGANSSTLTLSGVTVGMNNNQYMCVVTMGTCPINSLIGSLTVSAQPSLVITNPPTTCAPGTVDITAAAVTAGSTLAGGTLTYWNDIAFTSPVSNPSAISVGGTYYIRVATSAICYDIKPVVVSISSSISNNNISASQAICTGSAPTGLTGTAPGGGTGVYTYQWQQSADNVTYTNIAGATSANYSPGILAATTWYKRVVNSGTCIGTSSAVQITVVSYPTATITYAGSPFCATGTATVTQSGQTGGTYSASPAGLSINSLNGTINLAASSANTYTVTYSFSNGTCNGTTTTSVVVNALPIATIAYAGSPYCATGTATPTQTGISGGTYSGPAGLVIDPTTGAVNLSASTVGTYTVNYFYSNGTCSNITTASITITALPTAAIAYAGSPYCAVGTATPTQSGTPGGTYSSTAGLVINSANGNIDLVASTAGTYTVTYTFTAGACSNTTTANITITALPAATISYGGSPFCKTVGAAQPVTQTGTTGGVYSSTAGLTINAATGAVTPGTSTAGTYTVTYTMAATGGCTVQTATTSVTITALPVATFSYTGTPYCQSAANPSPTFSGGGVAGTFSSTAGLVFVSTTTGQINLSASTPGTYTVTNTIAASGGCAAVTATSSVTITALPVATFSYAGSPYCKSAANPNPTFSGGGVAGTFSSTAGLVFVSASTGQINLAASTPGTYTVTNTIAASGGCTAQTATSSITITALPVATFSYTGTPYCQSAANPSPTFSGGGVAGTFSSTAGLVFVSTATGQINLAASTPGTYTVTNTIAASGGCAVVTATSSITITALPVATFSYTASPYCKNAANPSPTFSGGGVAGTFTSTAGLVFVSAATGQINLAASTPGTYTVTNTIAAAGGCTAQTATSSITITALPVATFSYTGTPYCQSAGNPSPTFSGGGVAGTFSSTAGLVFVSTTTGQINLLASTPGTYTVTNTIAASGGCAVVIATSSITITALPVATFSYTGTPYCRNAANPSPTFSGGGVAGTFSSTAGLVFVSAATGQINLTASTPGTYTVTNTIAAAGGCTAQTATSSVTITALPVATFSYTGSPYCQTAGNPSPTFSGGGVAGTFSSTAGLVFVSTTTGQINLSASTPGTYTVTNTIAASGGCAIVTATASITITALPSATISYAGTPFCKSLATGQPVTQTGTTGGTYSSTGGLTIDPTTGAITPSTSTAGTYTVTYTMAAAGGCTAQTATTSVTITTLPAATINYAGSPFCNSLAAAQPVTRTGTAGGTYSSTVGLTIDPTTGAITPNTSIPGTYTVTYTIAAVGGCAVVTATNSVTITALPIATFSYTASPYCKNSANPSPTFSGGGVAGTFSLTAGLVFVSTATGQVDLTASTPGTYTVKNTIAASGGCAAVTATSSITITALPVATFSYTGSPYCQSAANPNPTFSGGGVAGTFSSTAGLVFVSTSTGQINLSASTPGTYTVTNTIAAAGGCAVVTATSSITITTLPSATFSYTGTPYCQSAANPSPTFSGGGVAGTFSSTAGLVFVSTTTGQINLSASTPGTYTVTNTIAASGGCAAVTATSSVTITALPVATFSYAGSPYCKSAANPNPTFSGGGVAGTFSSTAGLVFVSASTGQINLAASTPGTYTVTNTIAASGGCTAQTATSSITITALPVATFSYTGTPYCQSAANPSPTFSGGGVAGTFSSTAGLVFVSTATGQINLAASTPGTYTVTNTIAASGGCAVVTATSSITITALPAATISYGGSPFCKTVGAAQPVTQTGTTGGVYSSTAGLTINAATGAITPSTSTAGTYTVTYTMAATGGCTVQTATTSVTITALPVATFSYTGTPYCQSAANPSPTFSGGGVAGTFSSTAGLVFVSTTTGQINLSASTPGTYTVTNTIAASGGCGVVTATSSVTITALPVATFSYAGSPYCKNAANPSPTFSGGGVAGTFSSTAGLVFVSASTGQINLAASTPGTYTVTNTIAAAGGCTAQTATSSVTITALPVATINYAGSPYCATGTAAVTQTGITGGTYTAPAGVSISSTTGAIDLVASTPGTYTVTYSFTSGACSNTTTASITITALPTATIAYSGSPYCATGTAVPTQTGTPGGTYTAPAGVVINGSTGAINLATSTPGTYTITYSFSSGACSNTTTASITITALPIATIAYAGSPYCATGTAVPTQTGTPGGTYTAPAGVVINGSTGAINLSTSTPGTYTITYSFSSGACSNTITASITITALPTAIISYAGSPYCAVGTATPTQSGTPGGTYSSTPGLVINSANGNIDLVASTAGTYTVTYTFTAGACSNTTTANITITALPAATISYGGSPFCKTVGAAQPVTQTGTTGGVYSSTAGLTINAATGAVTPSTSTAGTYTVTYTMAATGGCTVQTATTSVTITALPVATFSYTGTPYCQSAANPSPTFSGGGVAGTFSSTAGLVFVSTTTGQINLSASTPGTYTVTNTIAASGGCAAVTATSSVTITALPVATISYTGSPFCSSLVGSQPVTQTGTSGGIYSSAAGLTIDATTGAITPSTSTVGTYTVTYTMAATGGCAAQTATTSVAITAFPIATFSYTGTPFCQSAANPSPTFGGGGVAGTFSSTAGIVFVSTATGQINLAASTPGTYTVTNTIAASGSCATQTATSSVTITALPAATISYAGSPFCKSLVAAQPVNQTGTTGGIYSSTAGLTIDPTTGAITPSTSTAGIYTVTYTMAATGGCTAQTATSSVTIAALPNATIAYSGSPYCATGTATVTQTGTAGGTYTAPAGVVINSSTGAINLATSTPGTYTITYSFTAGTCSNTTTASITIVALPTATIAYSGSPYCATGNATVTQTGTAGGTYTAPAGVVINSSTGAINLATSTAGTYTITYSFTAGTCSNTTTASITIVALPTATIAYSGSPYCATGTATVTQTGTAGGTYTAPAGVVINSSTGAINLATSTPGTYTITYSFTAGTCSNTTTASITIVALPTATIAYSGSPYCATGTATVTQTGTAGGIYTAPAGVVINSSTGAINLATSTPGTYTITYSFTAGACSNTTTANITITALPIATIAYAGSPYCATGTATVTQTGTAGGTYTAPAGLVIDVTTGVIDLAASTTGTYTVTYSFTSGACNNSTTASITIVTLPTATIAYSGSPYCATGTATVTQTGTAGGTYTAPAGVVINSSTGAINLATSTPGTYTITYSFTAGACSNSTTTSITINALPAATISYAGSPYCATGTATVTQSGQAGGTYSSTAGLVLNASNGDIDLVASTAGTYTVTYSFTNGTCINTTTASITINALPTATIAYASSPYCATGTATVTQTGTTGGTYSAPAAVSINPATGTINLGSSTPGTYTITYTFTNGICSNTTSTSITINALPSATIAYTGSPYCGTGTATVTQSGQAGGTYTAPAGININSPTGDINLATSTPGTYTITYTFTNGTCSNATSTSITINALPTASIAYTGSPYCATGTATPTQTGTPGGTYTAPAGIVINGATGAIDLGTSTPGTYTITYSFISGACSNTTTTSITISALPVAAISYTGSPYCATGTATVTQTGIAGGVYTAPAGIIINPSTGDINLATSTPGTYVINYDYSNGTCSNIVTTNITINALPTATINYAGSPYCATGIATVTQTGTPGGTYTSTPGLVINAATGDIDLAASTSGTYTVTYLFNNGTCSNTTTANVTINTLPIASIAYAGSPYCATATATVTQSGQTGGVYSAPASVSINSATGDINLSASTSGTYTITYTFSNGTCSNTTTTSVTINALPTATISYAGSPYCATGTAIVTQSGQTGGTYTSTPGLVINSATGDIDLVASTAGTYSVTYSFGNGTCTNTTTTSITINPLPVATISYAASPYCATGTATVTETGQAGGTFTAPAGVVINGVTGDVDLAASTAGTYIITYTFSNGVCSNSTTASITINALPTATIAYTAAPYCVTGIANVSLAGQTGGTFSAPAAVNINSVTGDIDLSTSTPGTYTITYLFSNGTCSNTTTTSITINALPIAAISYAGSPYCATGVATVTQTGQAGGTYSSTAGLSITAATGDIDLATTTPGTYTVTYNFTNGICTNSTSTNVTIIALPVATINYPGSPYCLTGTATVMQSGITGGFYSAPAGVSINGVSGDINLATSTPGTYTVTYTFSNGICSNTTTTSITINALPTATINYSGSPYCAIGVAAVTQAGQGGGTYSSTAGLVINPSTGAITLTASTAGTYTVTYTFGNGTCSNTATTSVTINALPTASISYNGSPYCTNGVAIVSLSGVGGGTYASSAGLSLNTNTGDINLAASTQGTYTVIYTFSNGTCTNNTFTTVVIKNPALVINSPAGTCYPATIDLTNPAVTSGSQAGLTYNYYQDITGTTPLLNPADVGTAGTYYIQGVDISTGCASNIQPVLVTIFSKPTVTASASSTDVCKGTSITLTAVSAGNTINWLGVGPGNVVTVTPMDSTVYMAVATTTNGCMDTASVDIAVQPFIITLTANPDPVLAGTNTTFTTTANFAYNVVSWSPGNLFTDQTTTTQNIVVNDTTTSFSVIGQSTDGCLDTATLNIVVDANLKDFFIPNSFSPNNDGNNDIFKVYGTSVKEVTLRVYNQWGELVFESENASEGWDGTWKGRPQAVGVYVYVAKVTFYNNVTMKRKGTINLIR